MLARMERNFIRRNRWHYETGHKGTSCAKLSPRYRAFCAKLRLFGFDTRRIIDVSIENLFRGIFFLRRNIENFQDFEFLDITAVNWKCLQIANVRRIHDFLEISRILRIYVEKRRKYLDKMYAQFWKEAKSSSRLCNMQIKWELTRNYILVETTSNFFRNYKYIYIGIFFDFNSIDSKIFESMRMHKRYFVVSTKRSRTQWRLSVLNNSAGNSCERN